VRTEVRSELTLKMYVSGQWRDARSGERVAVANPATEEVVAEVPYGSRRECAEAIQIAHSAMKAWQQLSAYERAAKLDKVAALVRERSEELARLLTMEVGKALPESRGEIEASAALFEWFAEECKRAYGRTIPATSTAKRHLVIKHPVGVCATISAWNFPVYLQARKIAPALAAGCTVVTRAATQAPLALMGLFNCIDEAGVMAGAANLVTGKPVELADEFLSNPLCRKISFTGSTDVGKELMRKAADQVKRLSLELGGSAPFVVFPEVDVEDAAKRAVAAKFRNMGQVCISPARFYVHEAIYEPFVEHAVAFASALRLGNGLDPDVDAGPLFDRSRVEAMDKLVADAVGRGGRVLCGGHSPRGDQFGKGSFYLPTVIVDVDGAMDLNCVETFGPIMPIYRFRDTDEAIEKSNDTCFGLAAYVLTSDLGTAIRMAESLEFGIIGIGDMTPAAAQCPFGGMKESGLGRECAAEGLDAYLETKYVSLAV